MANTKRDWRKLGEILLRRGLLDEKKLQAGLTAQGRLLQPLASTLHAEDVLGEEPLVEALAEQFGMPGVVLSQSNLDLSRLALVPKKIALSHRVLPLPAVEGSLNVVVASPKDQGLLDEISFASGANVLPYVALRLELERTIEAAYQAREQGLSVLNLNSDPDAGLKIVQPPPATIDTPKIQPELAGGELDAFPEAPVPTPRPAGSKPRILVVDDEASILDIIEKALTHRGMEVVKASRGREALEQLRATPPDLVLLDAMLPEIHGFEICSQIKRSEQYGHIPVIMISAVYTGWNIIQDVKSMYQADDYVTKPFRVMELVRKVEETLAKSEGRSPSPEQARAHESAQQALSEAGIALKEGRVEDCVAAAQRAVRADPFDARGHFLLATILHKAGRVYEAISAYERVVELAPGQFMALKNLAVLYERQGFKSKAVEVWTRALNLSPTDAVRQTIKSHVMGLL